MTDSNAASERASFLERAEELTSLIAVDAEDARYLLSTFDYHVTRAMFMKSGRGDVKVLRRALTVLAALGRGVTGGTFIDVGANIGTSTVPALRTCGFARAVACEPEPRNLSLLELNLVANDLERDVTVCRGAISDSDGEVEFLVSERRWGSHQIHEAGSALPGWTRNPYRAITVPRVKLDTLASGGAFDPDDVTLLWMDAEGHEGHILRGGSFLTERGIPVVMELDPKGLQRQRGLDLVKDAALTHYTHYVRLRQARGRKQMRFDLEPTESLAEEIDWLVSAGRFTDILLVRDPISRPHRGGAPRPPAQPGQAFSPPDRVLRDPSVIPAGERRQFLQEAKRLTPLVAADIDGATFLVRTSAAAEEHPLFVQRSHVRLGLLDAVVSALDELGLGEQARDRTFLELGAGTGIATVAALRWHGFRRAVACEGDLSAYRVLKLNVAANGLGERVRALPVTPAESVAGRPLSQLTAADGVPGSRDGDVAKRPVLAVEEVTLDFLTQRGVIAPGEPGLVWGNGAGLARPILTGGQTVLELGPPLVLRLDSRSSLDSVSPDGVLAETHTHFVRMGKPGLAPASSRLAPIASLTDLLSQLAGMEVGRSVHLLAVRLAPR